MPNIHTPERLTGESFKDYKARRKHSQAVAKQGMRCFSVLWNSGRQGTFKHKNAR